MNTKYFEDSLLRVEKIFHLASQAQGDALIDDIFELYEYDPEEFEEMLNIFFNHNYDMDKEELAWCLCRQNKKGFLVQMATPVPSNFHKSGSFTTNGWGHYSTKFFYTDTLEACYLQGAKWQKEYYEEVRKKEAA